MQSTKEWTRQIGYTLWNSKENITSKSSSMLGWGGGGGGGTAVSALETAKSSAGTDGSGSSLDDLVSSEGPSSGLYVNWSCIQWNH